MMTQFSDIYASSGLQELKLEGLFFQIFQSAHDILTLFFVFFFVQSDRMHKIFLQDTGIYPSVMADFSGKQVHFWTI